MPGDIRFDAIVADLKAKRVSQITGLKQIDMNRMARDIDKLFRKNERRLFSTEGASGGEKWEALSPRYGAWKRRVARGRKILVLGRRSKLFKGQKVSTGSIRESLTKAGHPDHIARGHLATSKIASPFVEVGTRDDVAPYHINPSVVGLPNAKYNKNLPHRDPLQHTATQGSEYLQVPKQVIMKKIERLNRVLQRRLERRGKK